MKLTFTFILLFVFFTTGHSQNYKQVRIYLDTIQNIETLQKLGLEFDHPQLTKNNTVIVFVNDDEYFLLQTSNFKYYVLIDDWYAHYSSFQKLSQSERNDFQEKSKREMNVSGFGFGSMGGFYTLAEVLAELDNMKVLFPDLITSKASIGNTVENRPMYMVKISDNPEIDEMEPEILYTALHQCS